MGVSESRMEPTAQAAQSGLFGIPVATVGTWWPLFKKRCPRLGCGVDGFQTVFTALLPKEASSPAQLDQAFKAFDSANRGLIDGLELFAALVLLSQGTLEARVELLFVIFDMTGRETLDRSSLSLLLERATSGLSKCCSCHGFRVPPSLPRTMADRAFRGRPLSESMTRAQFTEWWQRNAVVRNVLLRCVDSLDDDEGLPGEDEWIEQQYKELQELEEPEPAPALALTILPSEQMLEAPTVFNCVNLPALPSEYWLSLQAKTVDTGTLQS